jgi:UDP-N-acetylmuramoyl-L-alanyl-D-glutamate--2,6-diaminopimelate ligase
MDRSPASSEISLRAILPDALLHGADDIVVERCSSDSRRCRPGDLFAALKGTRHDGHDHVDEAIRQGAAAVLCERPLAQLTRPWCQVANSAEAYGRICQALAGNPSRRLKVIGVTGTSGKTTTSYLIASVLSTAGHLTGVMGTLGSCDGVDIEATRLTTPGAPTLAAWLARCETNGCSHAVMEVSSHALAQCRVAGIDFDAACVTNVRHDHLDYHHDWQNYRAAKARLLDQLNPCGVAVLNADDRGSISLLDEAPGPALTIGVDAAAEITATPVEQHVSEQLFLLSSGEESIPVRTTLVGRHNIENCLMAAAVGLAYGIDLPTIVRGLESVTRIPGRLDRIECGQPFGVFVDYAHTPDALTVVLETLREVTRGRLICVFGAGGDRDRSKRPLMGRAVEQLADLAVVTSDNPRQESPLAIIDDVLSGIEDRFAVRTIVDRGEAIHWALAAARPGDCVLIAGKGHETHQIVGERKIACDDVQLASQWLYRNQAPVLMRRAA